MLGISADVTKPKAFGELRQETSDLVDKAIGRFLALLPNLCQFYPHKENLHVMPSPLKPCPGALFAVCT